MSFWAQKIYISQETQEMRKIASKFDVKFGCIDGAYVPLKRPLINSQNFYNYKQFFSLNVQAVCDSQGRFIDVECKWPRSAHDAKIFENSTVCKKLQFRKINQTSLNLLPGYDTLPNYINGDPAYPLTPYCMKKYLTCVENMKVVFNYLLRSARNRIECAFERLKARWRVWEMACYSC